jgi:prevent-host-death family protein
MRSVSIRDVRAHLAALLAQVSAGQVIAITRRGHEVARIVPADQAARTLPSRTQARGRMAKPGRPSRSTVVVMRTEERW